MSIESVSVAVVEANIEKCRIAKADLAPLLHTTCLQCLKQMYDHGNALLAQKLYAAMDGTLNGKREGAVITFNEGEYKGRKFKEILGPAPKGKGNKSVVRAEAIKAWFFEMSGKQATARSEVWGMTKGWTKDKFRLEDAETTPFWELTREQEIVRGFTISSWLDSLENVLDRLQLAFEKQGTAEAEGKDLQGKHYFAGDIQQQKAAATDIINFAKVRISKLSAQARGDAPTLTTTETLPENQPESTLIRNGQVVEREQAVA